MELTLWICAFDVNMFYKKDKGFKILMKMRSTNVQGRTNKVVTGGFLLQSLLKFVPVEYFSLIQYFF